MHYDVISAFIKSIGSDPNAAMYWLARMVKAMKIKIYS